MLTTLITLSLALYGFASPLKRDSSINVSLSRPATSIDDLKFTATVSNTSSESVKILKRDTEIKVAFRDLISPGRPIHLVAISLEDIDDSAFAFISPGQSVTADHNFGPGALAFSPVASFQMINAEATLTNGASFHQASVFSSSVVVNISGDLVKRYLPVGDKHAVDVCTRKCFIDASYTEGKALASMVSAYISANGSNSLYRAYYGSTPTSAVRTVFDNVANETSNSRKPTDWTAGIDMVFVILVSALPLQDIYFCDIFFNEVPQTDLCGGSFTTVRSHNVRGGTVLHELTHLISDTLDVTYGCTNDQNLLAAEQVVNADNYNCFATEVY